MSHDLGRQKDINTGQTNIYRELCGTRVPIRTVGRQLSAPEVRSAPPQQSVLGRTAYC